MANPLGWVNAGIDLFGNLFGSIFGANKEMELLEKQQEFQWQTMLHQNQWNEDMMYKQADLEGQQYMKYQSPSAQRRLMESAGINPFVQGSAVQPMSVGSASNASPASSSGGLPGASGRGIGQIYQAMGGALGHALQLKADLDIKKEQARNIAADTASKENENSLFPLVRRIRESTAIQSEVKEKILEHEETIKRAETLFQGIKFIEESNQRIAQTKLAIGQLKRLETLGQLDRAHVNLLIQQALTEISKQGLLNEQSLTEVRKRFNLDADTSNKTVNTNVQQYNLDNILPEEKQRLVKQSEKLNADIQHLDFTQKKAKLDTLLRAAGIDMPASSDGTDLVGELLTSIRRVSAMLQWGEHIKKSFKEVYGVDL